MKREPQVPKKSIWTVVRKALLVVLASLGLGLFAVTCLSALAGNLSDLPDKPYVIFSLVLSTIFFIVIGCVAYDDPSNNTRGRGGRSLDFGDIDGWGGSDGCDGGGSCSGSDGGGDGD